MGNKILDSTKSQTTERILLGIFFSFTGTGHLTFMRTEFLAQVPNWVPMDRDTVVLLSGVVEIILGVSLLFLVKQRTTVGWIVALFLIAVFPGNIAQLVNHNYAFGLNSDLLLWLRLPFQPILIAIVLWSTGAWGEWRRKIKFNHQVHPTMQ
ncbi:MAG: hypothetical protein H0W73_15000 [Bacteroidetes bacterium]|nr:hypothetical protein [Bacteroidota bacterium]